MSDETKSELGTYELWASGFTPESLDRALVDQARLQRGQLNDGDEYARYSPSQPSKGLSDVMREGRDDADYREWNEDTGFSGVNRWPDGPGVKSEGQSRRRERRRELDDGF